MSVSLVPPHPPHIHPRHSSARASCVSCKFYRPRDVMTVAAPSLTPSEWDAGATWREPLKAFIFDCRQQLFSLWWEWCSHDGGVHTRGDVHTAVHAQNRGVATRQFRPTGHVLALTSAAFLLFNGTARDVWRKIKFLERVTVI